MDNLKNMKDALIHQVQAQINGNLDKVDAKELGEAVDMIKDLAQTMYYCTIIEAMEENKEREEEYPEDEMRMYYPMRYYPRRRRYHGDSWNYPYWGGPYYYTESNNRGNDARGGGTRGYTEGNYDDHGRRYHEDIYDAYRDLERAYPREMRDYREGKSGMSRRYYVEAKEQHKDQTTRNQELSKYMQELSDDIVEMIQDATPEEKQMLQQKLNTLSGKIK